jgi:glycosyltransferase involved in cell wall biosynthesis
MLERITPIILTLNEASNIGRALDQLRWAREVVVVDSLSSDATKEIVARYPNTRWVERKFDGLAKQWNYALAETGLATDWVFALNADYWLPPALIAELAALDPPPQVAGYRNRFVYGIFGRPLRGSLYPPHIHLFDRRRARIYQDGHTEAVEILDGEVRELKEPIHHDDYKPLERFFASQTRYMRDEAEKLQRADPARLSLADRLRRRKYLAPLAVLIYCLFGKGLILDGRAGLYYALQRVTAELMLSLYLIDRDLRKPRE